MTLLNILSILLDFFAERHIIPPATAAERQFFIGAWLRGTLLRVEDGTGREAL